MFSFVDRNHESLLETIYTNKDMSFPILTTACNLRRAKLLLLIGRTRSFGKTTKQICCNS